MFSPRAREAAAYQGAFLDRSLQACLLKASLPAAGLGG